MLGQFIEEISVYHPKVVGALANYSKLRKTIPDIARGPLFYEACTLMHLSEKRWLLNQALLNKDLPDALERVNWALRMGAPVNIIVNDDPLPLEYAIDMHWPNAIQSLVNYGADWDAVRPSADESVNTPRKYLASYIAELEATLATLSAIRDRVDQNFSEDTTETVYGSQDEVVDNGESTDEEDEPADNMVVDEPADQDEDETVDNMVADEPTTNEAVSESVSEVVDNAVSEVVSDAVSESANGAVGEVISEIALYF